jgi:hypothetical protein
MKQVFVVIFILLLFFLFLTGGKLMYNIRDRHSGYELDIKLPIQPSASSAKQIHVGLAKLPITPNVEDTWTDADSNGQFEPNKGDFYQDKNNNGKFDAFWLAGFQNNRPAAGVHDDIWARTIVFDDGHLKIAFVVLDAIGLFHDHVISIRKMVEDENLDINHVIISSTHNHEVPDPMGLWGPKFYKSGINDDYLQFVKDQTVQSIKDAIKASRPAKIKLSKIDSTASDLIRDSRPPKVLDDGIHMMFFVDSETDTTLGILLNWGNHPETLADDNLQITSDYAHYWLKAVESGIEYDGEIKQPGIGGIAVWANGAVGGLMTSLGTNIYDPWREKYYKEATFDKAEAQGNRLAKLVLDQVENGEWHLVETPQLKLAAKTVPFKVSNKYFMLGGMLGIFKRGFYKFRYMRSEIDLLAIGNDAWILTIPGEVNPEIINGGIEIPEGADFPEKIVEAPALRKLMKARYNFVVGLGNDELGYIMPKSHWDKKPPFTYGKKKGMYGEVNSLGPEAGPTLYKNAKEIIESM